MSIEKQLETLNENLARLCNTLEANAAGDAPTEGVKQKEKPAAEKKKADPKKEKPAAVAEEAMDESELDYDTDVRPFVLENTKEHRDEIVGILSRFGCKTAKELKVADYRSFLDRLANAIENGLESDAEFAGDE